eukprot:366134-Chlamydomonas_euryale.AAC.7
MAGGRPSKQQLIPPTAAHGREEEAGCAGRRPLRRRARVRVGLKFGRRVVRFGSDPDFLDFHTHAHTLSGQPKALLDSTKRLPGL